MSVAVAAAQQQNPGFAIGTMIADRTRNDVYVLDLTNNRVVQVDTGSGRKTAHVGIAGAPADLAINPEGTELYVSSRAANTIQVYALPDLAPLRTLDVSQPNRIAVGVGGRVYVSGTSQGSAIRQVEAATGTTLRSFGSFYSGLPRTNVAGTKLFMSEVGLSTTDTTEYDISNPNAAIVAGPSYPTRMANGRDVAVDEAYNRLYGMSGGVYGVQAVDRATRTGTTWGFTDGAAYGASVDVNEAVPHFFATAQDPYRGGVFKYDRATGAVLEHYLPAGSYKSSWDVAITPNGRAIFSADTDYSVSGDQLGIIGAPSLAIASIPNAAFAATVATVPSRTVTFDATASSDYEPGGTIASYAWDFGDGTTGTGATPAHTYAANGRYTVRLVVADAQGNADEFARVLNLSTAPTGVSKAVRTNEETPVSATLEGADADGDPLTFAIATPPSNGKAVLAGDVLTYTPDKDFFGTDRIVYRISDGGRTTLASITVRVDNVGDAPRALPDLVALDATGTVTVNVLGNDVDPDGDPLTITFATPRYGTVALAGSKLVYTATTPGMADAFAYTISDGTATSTATVSVSPAAALLPGTWPTYGGTAAHAGYVAGTTGAAAPLAGWTLPTGASSSGRSVAIAEGRVFVSGVVASGLAVTAYDLSNGQQLWQHTFPAGNSINAPTYYNGRIYVQRGNHGGDTQLWALNAYSGATIWSAAFGAQWESYYAPAVDASGIWINGGYYGGMYGFRHDGTQITFESLAQFDQWTPSLLDGSVYSYVSGQFTKWDTAGNSIWTNTKAWSWSGWSMDRTSALAGDAAYLVGNPDFYSVDLATGATRWTVPGNFTGTPAVRGDTAYVIQGSSVRAYDAATGALVRTYAAPSTTAWLNQPLVTDDSVLAASSGETFVFDRATGALRYSIPFGGRLALSNNRLVIVTPNGAVKSYDFASPLAADAGGPYRVDERGNVTVTATATSTTGSPIVAWDWDFDYDGVTFSTHANGQSANLNAFNIDGPGRRRVAVRVRDAAGNVAIAGAELRIDNVAPTATFSLPASVALGSAATASFSSPDDHTYDIGMGLRYSFDFNGDGDFDDAGDVRDSASRSASFTFASAGTFSVRGRVADVDGGFTDYTRSITVVAPTPPPAPTGVGFDNYAVNEAAAQTLFGYAGPLASGQSIASWQWDFDYDGVTFGVDATGQRPTFTVDDGPATRTVALRVTDNHGQVVTRVQTLRIDNVAPTGTFTATTLAPAGSATTLAFTAATDASAADRAAGFRYSFDFNGDRDFADAGDVLNGTSPGASFTFAAAGNYPVVGRVTDKDGGSSTYTLTLVVPAAPAAPEPTKLGVTLMGTPGSFGNGGNTFAKAFDGDLNTYFDSNVANGAWVGIDAGGARTITSARFAPRAGWPGRMIGGRFEASNAANFSGAVTLGTIATAPLVGTLTTITFNNPAGFRYVRYVGPNGSYGNVAEVSFYGVLPTTTPPPTPPPPTTGGTLAGTPIGTAGSFGNSGNTFAKAFDGSLSTYFDSTAVNGAWAGLDLGTVKSVTGVRFAPRSGYATRMVGGRFEGSNDGGFAGATTLGTIAAAPVVGSLTTLTFATAGSYRYVRYVAPSGSYGNVAEVQFLGGNGTTPPPTAPTLTKLTGATIGTAGSFGGSANTIAKALDGDLNSYYDGASASNNWVGLDLGVATVIKQVAFAPRGGWATRMIGGIFQGSNDAGFAGATTLYTVASAPPAGTLTTAAVGVATAFRYVRYVAPANSYGNVAEVAFYR